LLITPSETDVTSDGISRVVEVIDELLESILPRTWLGEDWLPLPKVRPGHGGDDSDGSGGALVSSVASDLLDLGRDVPEACGDGAPLCVHRVYGNSGSLQKGLDLQLQVWEMKELEQKLGEDHQR